MTDKRNKMLEKIKENSIKVVGSRIKRREYFILEGNEEAKLPKKAIIMLEIIYSQDKTRLTEEELFELIDKNGAKIGGKQSPWKNFTYYRKVLVDEKFISYNNIVEEKEDKKDG